MPDGDTALIPNDVSACPSCSAWIPLPADAPPAPLTLSRGRLSGAGCFAEVSDRGLFTRAVAASSRAVVVRGLEPGHWLTRKGATLLFVGPPVILALAVAFGTPNAAEASLPAVVGLLLVALLSYILVRRTWKAGEDLPERARRLAWRRLVPQLHAEDFSMDESGFVAALALATLDMGRPLPPRRTLERVLGLTEDALAEGRPVVRHLAALRQLLSTETAVRGEDPVPLLAAQLARCFEGRMPPGYATELLSGKAAAQWSEESWVRLGLLVSERAFEAGCEVCHLSEAGRLVPRLAELLQTADTARLAQLRLLWSLRASRPWDRCAPAATAFELARVADGGGRLARYPDLLLHHRTPLARARAGQRQEDLTQGDIIICGRGLVFQDVLFREIPVRIEVVSRGLYRRGGHKLVIGDRTFRLPDDPEPLARLLERWFQYLFRNFLPQAAEAAGWQAQTGDAILRRWGTVACPKCRRIIRTRPGEVGEVLGLERSPETT